MIAKKILGWALVLAGVILIFWTILNSYNVFTNKAQPPEIFRANPSLQITQTPGSSLDVQAQMETILREQLMNLIPVNAVPGILNLTTWSLLAFILIYGGAQISGIGIRLLDKKE